MNAVVRGYLEALRNALRDTGALLLLVAAPVLYGFFYPWPYTLQAVTRVPVAIVDQDHTSLSRELVRFAQASPRIEVRWTGSDEHEAREALWRGEIEGYAVLPADLKRHVLRGEPATVVVEGDGAYALLNKAVLYGFAEAVGTVSAGVEIRKLQAAGQSAPQASASRSPINTQMVPLFNPTEGYGSYVVPAVALLILQQTLLMGAALLCGTWAEGASRSGQSQPALRLHADAATWVGRVLGVSTFGWVAGLFYMGWVFVWQDFPRGGNPLGALLLLGLYVPSVSAVGLALGLWFRDRERSMQVLLLTSLPMAFLSGFSWPVEALPLPLQALRWVIPSSSAITASLRLNQMGAPLAGVWPQLLALVLITLCAGICLYMGGRKPPDPVGCHKSIT